MININNIVIFDFGNILAILKPMKSIYKLYHTHQSVFQIHLSETGGFNLIERQLMHSYKKIKKNKYYSYTLYTLNI